MPVYHPFGQELVSRDEFLTRVAEVEPPTFDVGTVAGRGTAFVRLRTSSSANR